MAYTSTEFMLKEGTIQYGVWTDPDQIVPGTDPTASFSATDTPGYIRMGSINVHVDDERIEYLANTPHEIIRKDPIRRNYFWEFTANQFNATTLALLKNMEVQTGANTLVWIGPDQPVATRLGWLITGQRIDGVAMYFALWSGEVQTETNGVQPTGADYVDLPVIIQGFSHPDFGQTAQDNRRKYGMWYFPETS